MATVSRCNIRREGEWPDDFKALPRDIAMSQPSDANQTVTSIIDIAAGESRAFRRKWFEYRAYAIGSDGHFTQCDEMVCRNDDEAIAEAKRLIRNSDIEIWNRNRFVTRLVHPSK